LPNPTKRCGRGARVRVRVALVDGDRCRTQQNDLRRHGVRDDLDRDVKHGTVEFTVIRNDVHDELANDARVRRDRVADALVSGAVEDTNRQLDGVIVGI
jgi:hypothetical protein